MTEENESDDKIEIDQDDQEIVAVETEERPASRMGMILSSLEAEIQEEEIERECTPPLVKGTAPPTEPVDIMRKENGWVKCEDNLTKEDSELGEEIVFYENNDEEGDDDLDMDKILRNCPPTEVLQNLTDMVQLSKNMTSQLEKALRRTARITCGPLPRLPGSGLTKAEVIDTKCKKLVNDTEDFLGEINKNFLQFYKVMDHMDKVAAEQDSYVSTILVKRGSRDWRRSHAAIVRKMEKLWSRDYPRIITRKLTGRIKETIPELNEESDL